MIFQGAELWQGEVPSRWGVDWVHGWGEAGWSAEVETWVCWGWEGTTLALAFPLNYPFGLVVEGWEEAAAVWDWAEEVGGALDPAHRSEYLC